MNKEIKLDIKNKKILYQLDADASQSANQIAKKVGLSKEGVNYRINRMLKQKIIKGFYTVLNTPQLGFIHFNTLIRFRDINETLKKNFIDFCKKEEQIIWCASCYGSWDFSVSFLGKTIQEYDSFLSKILQRFGNKIHEKSMSVIIDSPTYHRDYLIDSQEGKEFKYKISKTSKIDETEQRILSTISQNARMNIIHIAEKIKTSKDIVHYRIKQLEKKEIIQGYRALIDSEKIGYIYYKMLFSLKNLTNEKETQLKNFCKINPNIIQFIRYLGNWEIQIELEVESEKQLYEILEQIRKQFNTIIKTYDILKLKEEKLDYFPFKLNSKIF